MNTVIAGADLTTEAAATGGAAAPAVHLARRLGPFVEPPGTGHTAERWRVLADVGAGDLSAARVVEAHLDARAILAEAGLPVDDADAWGVYAAEGPGVRVDARQRDGSWQLSGTKPWCSAASGLDRALVTAHVDGGRRLFAVDLRAPGVTTSTEGWVARGLAAIASGPVVLDRVRAEPVGETGWYLSRPGFAWGGMGVAACWYGGLLGLARSVWVAGHSREPDQIAVMHLGQIDLEVEAARLVLAAAATAVDQGRADGAAGVLLAERVRGVIAAAVESVIGATGRALGPAPLVFDEDHARRVADLQVYVRQHHGERDAARLGRLLLDGDAVPW